MSDKPKAICARCGWDHMPSDHPLPGETKTITPTEAIDILSLTPQQIIERQDTETVRLLIERCRELEVAKQVLYRTLEERQEREAKIEDATAEQSRNDALEADRDHWQLTAKSLQERLDAAKVRIAELEEQINRLRRAHHENCDALDSSPEGIVKPCNCGQRRIAELEAAAEQVLASAFPLPTEHPAMFAAFGRLQQALKGGAK